MSILFKENGFPQGVPDIINSYARSKDIEVITNGIKQERFFLSVARNVTALVQDVELVHPRDEMTQDEKNEHFYLLGWNLVTRITETIERVIANFAPVKGDPASIPNRIILPGKFIDGYGEEGYGFSLARRSFGAYSLMKGISPGSVAWYLGGIYRLEYKRKIKAMKE